MASFISELITFSLITENVPRKLSPTHLTLQASLLSEVVETALAHMQFDYVAIAHAMFYPSSSSEMQSQE